MGKILLFPFYLVKFAFGVVATIVKTTLSTSGGVLKFGFRNLPGILVGAAAALIGAKMLSDRKAQ